MMSIKRHASAFAGEVTDLLMVHPGQVVLDCTLGDGTHTEELLRSGATVISIDVDQEAIERSKQFIPPKLQKNWKVFRQNFGSIDLLFAENKLPIPSAILMDLGTSQYQLAAEARGFSFQHDAPLDMRLDDRLQVTAKDLVNGLGEGELIRLFSELSDETFARPIAKAIARFRERTPISTTLELANLISHVKHGRTKIHPATKVFQALRMAVNLEREALHSGLEKCFELLQSQGVLAVISFHSGEDRIVKHYFNQLELDGKGTLLNQKIIKPKENTLLSNPKIRSAKLRIIQKQ